MKENPFELHTNEYEEWFKENKILFESELLALERVIPNNKKGIEIGIGSGIFAERLGIEFGIDPSESMLKRAKERGLTVINGIAESLPYDDNSFDFTAFITSLCFIENPVEAMKEAYRITKRDGYIIIAFIDKESLLGEKIMKNKDKSKFYKPANFHSFKEIKSIMESANFNLDCVIQTLTNTKTSEIEKPVQGHGEGSFVVIRGIK